MSLEEEIKYARREIVSDGYDMSVGEVINLYRDREIKISPDFQRLFRWDLSRKTRFIESLLLGIPIPPIFVYQDENGVWELIDGLQRLSTVLEFVGILRGYKGDDEELYPPSSLDGTRFLPSLAKRKWDSTDAQTNDGIGQAQQLQVKRARLRVEILKQESDTEAKYELFQRLNTGGAGLSEQEVRNCVAVMVNEDFYKWLKKLSTNEAFVETIAQTDSASEKQIDMELALRFLAFRNVPYKNGLDVHEYLDEALMRIASSETFDLAGEKDVFERTFELLRSAMGPSAFKKWDEAVFKGKFLMSVFEVVATGTSKNLSAILALPNPTEFVEGRCKQLWGDGTFQANSGAGIRGTTRLANLLPMAEAFFKP
jgi:hypothetical protein